MRTKRVWRVSARLLASTSWISSTIATKKIHFNLFSREKSLVILSLGSGEILEKDEVLLGWGGFRNVLKFSPWYGGTGVVGGP